MKCVGICMYCLEKTVQFVTYFGYCFVAIEVVNCLAPSHLP